MNFIQLIEQLARRVGTHQIPVNPSATGLQGFIDSSALHYELMQQVARAIYETNRCRRLTDPVSADATFEALAPIRRAALQSPQTDVDGARLMEDLCSAIAMAFDLRTAPGLASKAASPARPPSGTQPVQFDPLRRWTK